MCERDSFSFERSQLIKTVVIDDELSKEEEVDILLVSEAERAEGIMDFLHLECNPTINFQRVGMSMSIVIARWWTV